MRFKIFLVSAAMFLSACGGGRGLNESRASVETRTQLVRGQEWFNRGCPREAANFFNDAVNQARLIDNKLFLVRAQNNLGASFIAINRLDEGAEWLERALELSSSLPDQPEMDKILGNFGALAYKSGRFQDAEFFWKQAVLNTRTEAAVKRKDSPVLHLTNLAQLKIDQKDYQQARAFIDQAGESAATPVEKARELSLRGVLALEENNLDAARVFLRQALEINRQNESTLYLARNLSALGRLELRAQNGLEASVNLDRAFFLWSALGDYTQAQAIYQLLAESNRKFKQPKNLNFYQEVLRDRDKSPLITPACF